MIDVILRTGRVTRLREPVRADAEALVAFLSALSDESRYQRFHGTVRVVPATVEPYLELDWHDRGALIATVAATRGRERVAALASFARLRDPRVAEVAFAVADQLQGDGIGTRLLEQLAERARAAGIETFVADVLRTNAPMLRVFADAGFVSTRTVRGDVVELRFPIASSSAYLARVDRRDHLAISRSLRPLLAPASVAVIGASSRAGSIGGEIFRNIVEGGFRGACHPVNRSGLPVAGATAYRAVAEIPGQVDLALICVPAPQVQPAAREALAAGAGALCVISSGFAERGAEGRRRQERLLALVRRYGVRLVGPNCLGVAVPPIGLNATFAGRALPTGPLAFASQSGALGLALLERADERGLGFSSFISMGNKADLSSNDLLEWWEDDDETRAVLLYLESFGNPSRFGRVAARVARRKPIVALKAGTSHAGSRAASSHTAALAGSESAVDALFREAGVQRVRTLEELLDAAAYLSAQPLPAGRRVGVVTNAGGLGILCADACEAAGLTLPELTAATRTRLRAVVPADAGLGNPVDLLGGATADLYAAALPIVLADPGVDALIVLFVPPVVARADDVARAICGAVGVADKPVLCSIISSDRGGQQLLRAAGIAEFAYPESAARALGLAAERADWLRRPLGIVRPPDDVDHYAARVVIDRALEAGDGWLGQAAIAALLRAYGIALLRTDVAADADEAVAAADVVGYPVAVKTALPGVHKARQGGVALGLADAVGVRAAAERIGGPLLVQRMAGGGAELFAGIVRDPVFGPLVAFGLGGTLTELTAAVAFRAVPVTDIACRELVHAGAAGRLVAGFAGAAPFDELALESLVQRLSALADAFPEIAELDLNPVAANARGYVALDARIRVEHPAARISVKSW